MLPCPRYAGSPSRISSRLAWTRVIGGPFQRSRQIAIAAMRRASLGQVDPPVGAGRDRLQPPLRGRRNHHRERRLRRRKGASRIVGQPQCEAIAGKRHDFDTLRFSTRDDPSAVREAQRRTRHQQPTRAPSCHRSGRRRCCRYRRHGQANKRHAATVRSIDMVDTAAATYGVRA